MRRTIAALGGTIIEDVLGRQGAELGYYRHPTIHGDRIVFVSEDDLWTVGVGGGGAQRLTANPASQSFPALSPDGSLVAFTSRDEGSPEAYVMPVGGGSARRMSWFGANTTVVGWSRSGNSVIVATDAHQPFQSLAGLVEVPLDGTPQQPLRHGPARAVTFDPAGRGLAIGRNSADPARWKRYRGGTAGTIWIDREGSGDFESMIELDGNLARPMWIGRHIYFLSDHEGHGNLYRCTPTGRNLRRLTSHENFYARHPATDGHSIVYHAGADLWLFDVADEDTRRLDVRIPSSRPQRNRKFVDAAKHLETIDLHPKGEGVVITARGTVASMPLWEGAVSQHLQLRDGQDSAGEYRLRLATWMPDGLRLVAVSDESGEERLVLFAVQGAAAPKLIGADIGRPYAIEPAPGGADRVALVNQRQEVLVVNLSSGAAKKIFRSNDSRPKGLAWSPDGRWLAFGADVTASTSAIFLADTTTGKVHQVTSGEFIDGFPSFDPQGRYLYFLSWRDFNPVADGMFFDFGFPLAAKPYLVPLQANEPSPFAAEHRPPRAPGGPANGGSNGPEGGADQPEADRPVSVDLDGIADRVVAVPVQAGRYTKIAGAAGRVLFSSVPVEGNLAEPATSGPTRPKGRLQAYDFGKEKVENIADGISGFDVSTDGKTLAIRTRSKLRVVPSSFRDDGSGGDEVGRETGWLDLGRIRVEVDPRAEWAQMTREAWRLQRDQFWSEDMSGVDWEDVYRRYSPLVERVGSRGEFSDLMWEMQGELGTSHAYEMGGDYRPTPSYDQGFLGADLESSRQSNSWQIGRIPQGDSWDPKSASPLLAPGLDIRQGDRILAVNGRSVDRSTSPARLLTDQAGKPVTITVKRGRRKERKVVVKAMRSERRLRYRDWVNGNRATVHNASDGAIGYIHVPDMGASGYSEFHRHFSTEVDRSGLIVDVRFNGGGNVSELLIQKLLRRRIGYDSRRYGQNPMPYPGDSPRGPMVALTNEWAGSDGDIFSHAFKLYGLGPLIGTRTWGGVVGIWPRHSLVDGTVTTQPEFSHWFSDVGWGLENYGTDPDIEVVITPQDYRAGADPQLQRGIAEVQGIVAGLATEDSEPPERPDKRAPRLPVLKT